MSPCPPTPTDTDTDHSTRPSLTPPLACTHIVAERAREGRRRVVSHQLECDVNNAYFDALSCGVELVHNSSTLRKWKLGHAYTGQSIEGGVRGVLAAASQCVGLEQVCSTIEAHVGPTSKYVQRGLAAAIAALPRPRQMKL